MKKKSESEDLRLQETEIDGEGNADFIAVIAAAIAAYESSLVSSNLIIRKINRIAGPVNAWNGVSRLECIASRKM